MIENIQETFQTLGNFIASVDFAKLFLAFLLYGFIGWTYESFVWAICEKKTFINRGFLLGPLCPIYGLVCVADFYLLRNIENPLVIFCTAMVVCCAFEYFISWFFEKLFHERWWDYSNYAFNLNGRISIYSGIFFGLAGLFLVKVLHPAVINTLSKMSDKTVIIFAIVMAVLLLTDIIITFCTIKNISKRLSRYHENIEAKTNKPFDYLNEHKNEMENTLVAKKGKQVMEKLEEANEKMIQKEKELKEKHEEANEILKEKAKEIIEKQEETAEHLKEKAKELKDKVVSVLPHSDNTSESEETESMENTADQDNQI